MKREKCHYCKSAISRRTINGLPNCTRPKCYSQAVYDLSKRENEVDEIDVSDIKPEELLAALYNAVRPMGMGVLQAIGGDMTSDAALALLNGNVQEGDYPVDHQRKAGKPAYFDYLHGRCLKVEINGKTLRVGLYDRDYGAGAAQRIVDSVREKQS